MENKEQKRYRFFLQNNGELQQTVLTIRGEEAFLKVVPQLSTITSKDLSGKDTPASTLAFFDTKTCIEPSIGEFLEKLSVPLYKYNLNKTHIGYFYGQRLRRMKPAVDDPILHRIAVNTNEYTNGYLIMDNDRNAEEFIESFMYRLEKDDPDSDFVSQLIKTSKEADGFKSFEYSIPPRLVNLINEYYVGMKAQHRYYSLSRNLELLDISIDIGKMLSYYSNFRELYRFTSDYDLRRDKLEEHTEKVEEQKARAKQKKLIPPGQLQLPGIDDYNK